MSDETQLDRIERLLETLIARKRSDDHLCNALADLVRRAANEVTPRLRSGILDDLEALLDEHRDAEP